MQVTCIICLRQTFYPILWQYNLLLYFRQHLQGFLEEVLSRINDLLTLNSPDNGVKHYLSDSDQLFMYETAGILVIQSQFPPEVRARS